MVKEQGASPESVMLTDYRSHRMLRDRVEELSKMYAEACGQRDHYQMLLQTHSALSIGWHRLADSKDALGRFIDPVTAGLPAPPLSPADQVTRNWLVVDATARGLSKGGNTK